jgi:beta-glucuronidase
VGWYDGPPEKADGLVWKSNYQKPLIMTEFGAEAPYGHHGPVTRRWTEEFQEKVYQHQVGMLKRISFLRGTCPWILMDFRSPRRPLTGIQDFYNRKGLLSDRGEKKKAYYVMKRFYQELSAASPARAQ